MIELKGKYNRDCKIFIDEVEPEAIALVQSILDRQVSEGVPVRIMPDVHSGKGIVIGFTMPLTGMLSPNYVGVDIGCGMASARFSGRTYIDLERIDAAIRAAVPMGFEIHAEPQFTELPYAEVQRIADKFTIKYNEKFKTSFVAPIYNEAWLNSKLKDLGVDATKFYNAIGTLGGGNHFIEMGRGEDRELWVTVHSGSRNFGLKVAEYWTRVAMGQVKVASSAYNQELNDILQNTVSKSDIPKRVQELKKKHGHGIDKEFLSGDELMGYLYDMLFAQQYAVWNRNQMLNAVRKAIGVKVFEEVIHSIHNCVDFTDLVVRKGAISSYEGQKVIIPFNMRDGILLCEGKSNADWNNSAPHGAGRLMSRSEAKHKVDMDKFKRSMKGIFSTSVTKETLDESPFAYKNSVVIEAAIEPTVTIVDRIKPILNIKDAGKTESWKERRDAKKKRDRERDRARDEKELIQQN